MPELTATCIHCGEVIRQIGDHVWWSNWDSHFQSKPTCKDGKREHFAPTLMRPRELTAEEAMAGLTRVHAKLIDVLMPALQDQPEWLGLLESIPDMVRTNDGQFPLESNRPDWFGQSDKWRAMQRSPFYPQLWLLGDGIAPSKLKDHMFEVLPARVGNVATCLAANLRGEINHYTLGYFGLVMQGIDDLIEWADAEVAKATVSKSAE